MKMPEAKAEPFGGDMHPRDASNIGRRGGSGGVTFGESRSVPKSPKSKGNWFSKDSMFEQFNAFTVPEKKTTLAQRDLPREEVYPSELSIQSKRSKGSIVDTQEFQRLLTQLVDGQGRIESQLREFSSLQPLVEEVKGDIKHLGERMRRVHKAPPELVTTMEPPELITRESIEVPSCSTDEALKSSGTDGRLSTATSSSEESSNDDSTEDHKSKLSLASAVKGMVNFHRKGTVHVNVGSAQLEQQSDDLDLTSLCKVTLGERQVFETAPASGRCPQWKHEESTSYVDETVLEFSVEVHGKSGCHSRVGKSSLHLSDCRKPGGFSGFLQLTEPAGHHSEDKADANQFGKLVVSVRLENDEDKPTSSPSGKLELFPSMCPTNSDNSNIVKASPSFQSMKSRPDGRRVSIANRLRQSMLAVTGCSSMLHSSQEHKKATQWPTTIPIREGLLEDSGLESQALNALKSTWFPMAASGTDARTTMLSRRDPADVQGMGSPTGLFSRIILDPGSSKILLYDLLSVLVLLHDFVVIPYMLAWDVPLEGWFKLSAWMSCIFWMCDIGMSYLTGYVHDGQVELRWWRVAKHYMKTWFIIDIGLVMIDVIGVVGTSVLAGKFARVFRVLRFIRVFSLIRALRVTGNLEHVLDRSTSELSGSVSYIFKIFVVLLWLGHVTCCGWYWIGMHASSGTGQRWFDSIENGFVVFGDLPQNYQYFTSFHWALSQISGNGVEIISPMNTAERIYNIACLVFGVLFGSALVSSLSATMIEVQMLKQERTAKIRVVRQFLGQNNIPSTLAYRVQKQLKERIGKQKRISTMDVPQLSLLSHKLRVELQFAIIGTHLLQHPLYSLCAEIDTHAVQCFCYETVEDVLTPPGEVIFAHNNDAEHVYLVISGELLYTQNPISAPHMMSESCANVGSGTWLSTAALWSHWKHVGNFEACTAAELLTLNTTGMLTVVFQHPVLGTIFREYGRQFHTRLTKAMPPYADWPSDLEVPFTSYAELVLAMSRELRTIVSMSALSKLRRERGLVATWQRQGLSTLEEEVRTGKSTVMITETGVVERVVAVAVLHLQCNDGRVLVQVGRCVNGQIYACCRLPGKHHVDSELPSEAVQRLIDTDLEPFKAGIKWDTSKYAEQDDESKESPTNGICTHYMRTAHFGFLDASFAMMPEKLRLTRRSPVRSSVGDMTKNFMSSSEPSPQLPFQSTAAFAVTSGPTTSIYAWLSPDLFHHYSESSTLTSIQSWLDEFDVPEDSKSFPPIRESNPGLSSVASSIGVGQHPYAVVPSQSEASVIE